MARHVSSALRRRQALVEIARDQHIRSDGAAHRLVGRDLAGRIVAAHAQLHVREAAVLDQHIPGLAGDVLRLGDAEPAAVIGGQRRVAAAEQLVERHARLARQRIVQRHVEHRQRHLRHALVAHMRHRLLAEVVHRRRIGVGDLAAFDEADQRLQQDRHHLEPDGHEREPEHAARAAALQLQVDQQERALGETADAGVEHALDRHHRAADADAGDFDGGVHDGRCLDWADKFPLPILHGERVRVRGSNMVLRRKVSAAPHPGPLPARAGRGKFTASARRSSRRAAAGMLSGTKKSGASSRLLSTRYFSKSFTPCS